MNLRKLMVIVLGCLALLSTFSLGSAKSPGGGSGGGGGSDPLCSLFPDCGAGGGGGTPDVSAWVPRQCSAAGANSFFVTRVQRFYLYRADKPLGCSDFLAGVTQNVDLKWLLRQNVLYVFFSVRKHRLGNGTYGGCGYVLQDY